MSSILIVLLSVCVISSAIRLRATYSANAPATVPNGIYQEILSTVYLDGRAIKTLAEPQYIESLEEITYRDELNEEELQSFYNFRNVRFISLVNNGQKKIPNFRNLPRIRKIQIKQTRVSVIEKNLLSNTPVEVLDLQRNQIDEIEKGAFGKKVHSVDLKCNLLKIISPDWFKNASHIEWLSLESNKISKLQENLFQKFTKLSELYLARNEIIELEPGSLSGPQYMHALDLGTNDISIINPDVFSSRHLQIKDLRISFNRMSFITAETMAKFTVLNASVIYGNPWQCHCVKSIRDWLPATNVKYVIPDQPTCVFTINYSKVCEQDVKLNDELYNTYISNLAAVDSRLCSNDAMNFDEEKRKALQDFKWENHGDIDLRK